MPSYREANILPSTASMRIEEETPGKGRAAFGGDITASLLMEIRAIVSLSTFSLLPKFARKPRNAKVLPVPLDVSVRSSAYT